MEHLVELKEQIIKKATEIAKADFMAYPDFEEHEADLSLADAVTILLSDHFPDTPSEDIYNLLISKIK